MQRTKNSKTNVTVLNPPYLANPVLEQANALQFFSVLQSCVFDGMQQGQYAVAVALQWKCCTLNSWHRSVYKNSIIWATSGLLLRLGLPEKRSKIIVLFLTVPSAERGRGQECWDRMRLWSERPWVMSQSYERATNRRILFLNKRHIGCKMKMDCLTDSGRYQTGY